MHGFTATPVGIVRASEEGMFLELDSRYIPAMKGLRGFGHLQVVWWFSELDGEQYRDILETPRPYRNGPETLGIFATRSPVRPNPIALSTVEVLGLDEERGVVRVAYVDAHDGSPILDIKPYTPSVDRVERPVVPEWCGHWPNSVEAAGDFDWESEFMF